MSNWIKIGKILKPHNLKGECVLFTRLSLSDLKTTLLNQPLAVQKPENKARLTCEITNIRPHKNHFLIRLKNINSRSESMEFTGSSLLAEKQLLKTKKGEEFFLCELLGFHFYDKSRGLLGEVKAFTYNGKQDILLVHKDKKIIHIPFIKPLVSKVTWKQKSIFGSLPKGWPGCDDENEN